MNGWKALVMIVAILAFVWLAMYIFKSVEKDMIMKKKAEAMSGILSGGKDMLTGFIPGR
jgi:D-alanyl-lipoteichoic acid acyltransferase DltB (MBOAT superfamily)